ncbi:MAG: ParB/RepB/Spo0J family partition protein [candidate division KSB1 bacterium]|nr:ParB/RepB/Spo0J family partition protein [candidate division KSB1 bacterium]MDZ7333533.1 ParB/RepB/Spo0J family partition protein [candidate division KSB1 bacterium]MDZ7358201.1 ParB/RepB/Spo0J family partition protein [candidate division KSB1 bacterium]MDZ7375849.1 ParB/RepB/Spo0J family partition protein [candidate division KSB1 bacterium]MDZ7398647.1 ParB/RepB/Spo0J family partition protein [candidate division KSB1 bacterium]
MKEAHLKQVNICLIDIDDRSYIFTFEAPLSQLIFSIKKVGVLHPPILEQLSEQRYRIVSGLKRVLAAQHLKIQESPAYVYEGHGTEPSLELFLLNLYENLGTRTLNEIEKALVLWKLIHVFGVSENEVISNFMPLMGLGPNEIVLQRYLKLVKLEDYLRSAIVEDFISPETAIALLDLSAQDRLTIFNLFQDTKAGKNNQKELLQLIQQISIIQNQSIEQLFESLALEPILLDTRLTPSQKLEKIKQTLKQSRYPKYAEIAEQFQKLKKNLKLPSNIILRPSPFFEDSDYSIELKFKNQEELSKAINVLAGLLEENKFIELETII